MWELLAGTAFAISEGTGRQITGNRSNARSAGGALLCVASFAILTARNAFPDWWAIMPVTGTVAIIAAGRGGWINRHVLAHPVSVWLGKISYALYLWHWPLLSLAFIVAGRTPSSIVRGALLTIAVVLAWLTTAVIERPIRFGPAKRWKLIAPCLLMIGVVYLGGMTYVRGDLGFRKGYSPDADVTTAKLGAGHEFVNACAACRPTNSDCFRSARPTSECAAISPCGETARPTRCIGGPCVNRHRANAGR